MTELERWLTTLSTVWVTVYCLCIHPADPFVAAENFLSANDLPAHYLDEVAEFIIKNTGDYHGPADTAVADPFTGTYIYIYMYTYMYSTCVDTPCVKCIHP